MELRKRFSLPLAFHEMIVAPYRSTSTDSPVGKLAVMRELSWEIETFGVGIVGRLGCSLVFGALHGVDRQTVFELRAGRSVQRVEDGERRLRVKFLRAHDKREVGMTGTTPLREARKVTRAPGVRPPRHLKHFVYAGVS